MIEGELEEANADYEALRRDYEEVGMNTLNGDEEGEEFAD